MQYFKPFLLLMSLIVIVSCATQPPQCPPGTTYNNQLKVCVQSSAIVECPNDSLVDLDKAVEMAIACVKNDSNNFNNAFATLISIANENPNIENGDKILRLINAVAIEAPFVSQEKAKMKWNRYFSPYLFVTTGYLYDNVVSYCPKLRELKNAIDEELGDKKIGLLGCMADQAHKDEVKEMYRQAEETAISLKMGLNAACRSTSSKKKNLIQ